jgi:O-antigen ligase
MNVFILLFFAANLFSMIFADNLGESFTIISRYIYSFLLYFLIVHLANSNSKIKKIIWFLIISGFLASLLGFYGYFIGNVSIFGGIQPLKDADNNGFARFLIPFIPLSVFLLNSQEQKYKKIVLAVFFFLITAAVVLTFSRSGFLALLLVLFLIFLRQKNKLKILGIFFLIFLLCLPLIPLTLWTRASTFLDVGTAGFHDGSFSERSAVVISGLNMFKDNFLFGVGVGNFPEVYPAYVLKGFESVDKVAHNTYLSVLAELGITGFLLFITIIFWSFKNINICKNDNPNLIVYGVEIALIGFLFFSFFLTSEYYYMLWLLVALTVCLKEAHK